MSYNKGAIIGESAHSKASHSSWQSALQNILPFLPLGIHELRPTTQRSHAHLPQPAHVCTLRKRSSALALAPLRGEGQRWQALNAPRCMVVGASGCTRLQTEQYSFRDTGPKSSALPSSATAVGERGPSASFKAALSIVCCIRVPRCLKGGTAT